MIRSLCLSVAALFMLLVMSACAASAGGGPTTWLDQPLDGDQVPLDLVKLQAHASDASGVGTFEFYVNETLLSSPAASGGRFSQALVEWVPPAPGTYVIRARAIGGSGSPGSDARAVILVGPALTPTPAPVTPPPPVSVIEPELLPVEGVPPPPAACPGPPVISSFTADPTAITYGQTITFSWGSITNADDAIIDAIGHIGLEGGSWPLKPPPISATYPMTTTTFTLSAVGCGGTATKQAIVTVADGPEVPATGCAAPVITSFTANPSTITAGQSTTLNWGELSNVSFAGIDQGIGHIPTSLSKGPAGSKTVSPTSTTTYTLSSTGCGGTVVQSVTVTVLPPAPIITVTPVPVCPGAPVISSFSANPTTITAGQSTTLSWGAVTNATSAWIDPGIGGVGTPGSMRVSPGGSTTYTLTATGCGGTVRRQVSVTVNPAPKPITATPAPLPPVTLTVPVLPTLDRTAPSISGVSVNPTSISRSGCGQKTTSSVSARVTDAGGISRVVVRLGGVGGGEVGMSGGDTYSATVGPFGSTGQVTIQIVAWDKAGNSSQAGGPSISVICLQ